MNNPAEQVKALAAQLVKNSPNKTVHAKQNYNRPTELKLLAVSLYSAGYSMRQIADICDVNHTTVHAWIHKDINSGLDDELNEVSQQVKETLSKKLYLHANKLFVSAMDDDKIDKSSTLQLATAGSIFIDKARLLDGQSTENVSMIYKRAEKAKNKKLELEKEIKELEDSLRTE